MILFISHQKYRGLRQKRLIFSWMLQLKGQLLRPRFFEALQVFMGFAKLGLIRVMEQDDNRFFDSVEMMQNLSISSLP